MNKIFLLLLSCSQFITNHILSQICKKKPCNQGFSLLLRYKVFTLLPANSHTQHDAFVGLKRFSGALKRLVLKSKSETFSCVSLTNSRTQRFAVTVSFRRKLLTLQQLYPRAPSRPSVSHYRMAEHDAFESTLCIFLRLYRFIFVFELID